MAPKHNLTFDNLDRRLQELALLNFTYFCTLTEVNKEKAIVCFERANGKTFRQIANKLRIGKSMVYKLSKKCPPLVDR